MVGQHPFRLAPWLLLGGCWVTPPEIADVIEGDADADADADSDSDVDTLEVLSVDPPYGSTGGGAIVTVNTGLLEGDVTVAFDGVEAEVVSVGGDEVVVETPPVDADGIVDVVVTAENGTGTLVEGFTYWEEGAGLVGAIGEIAQWDYRGGYWGEDLDYTEGSVRLLYPSDLRYADLWGGRTPDKCVNNAAPIDYPDAYGLSSRLSLVGSGSASFDLTRGGDVYSGDVADADWVTGTVYALELDAPGWPASVPAFLESPSALAITAPYIEGATFDDISYVSSSFALQWTTTSPGDLAVAMFIRYEGDVAADVVRCTLTDDGSFTVSASMFSGWQSGEQITIVMGRVALTNATLPTSGARIEVAGVRYAIGAVFVL